MDNVLDGDAPTAAQAFSAFILRVWIKEVGLLYTPEQGVRLANLGMRSQ